MKTFRTGCFLSPFLGDFMLRIWLTAVAVALSSRTATADASAATARIVGRDESFATIQAAIDAAEKGDVIELSAGRFGERIVIAKDLRLVGAGADQTVIGPTAEEQARLRESYETLWKSIDDAARAIEAERPRREATAAETADFKAKYDECKRLMTEYAQPVIGIDRAKNVELQSLKVTMPDTPRRDGGGMVTSAVLVKEHGGLRVDDCAVVGCFANGIGLEVVSRVTIVNSLVAACWGTGVYGTTNAEAVLNISNCDIRNNYHYNVGIRAGIVENCRISGSAWSGITGGANRVERNAIFDNARGGVYSVGKNGVVKHNLIYRNGSGLGASDPEQPVVEANLFLDNASGAIYVSGPCEPTIRRNLIVGSPIGVQYGPKQIAKGEKPSATAFHVEGNLFWRVETPVALFKSREPGALPTKIELAADAGDREVDPLVSMGADGQVVFAENSPVEAETAAALSAISIRSRWPLTPEEEAMIPDDGTRDWDKWKMRPERD